VLWAKLAGWATDVLYPSGLAVDQAGHCYWSASWFTGYLSGSFFSLELAFEGFILTNQGCSDMFLARFDTTTSCLNIKLVANTIRLSWPALATDFFLESATSLSPIASWSSNAVTPTVLGFSNVLTLPADKPLSFYRLRRP